MQSDNATDPDPRALVQVTSTVPWAAVFQDVPGDAPDFRTPIPPGESVTLGVQLSGQVGGVGAWARVMLCAHVTLRC